MTRFKATREGAPFPDRADRSSALTAGAMKRFLQGRVVLAKMSECRVGQYGRQHLRYKDAIWTSMNTSR